MKWKNLMWFDYLENFFKMFFRLGQRLIPLMVSVVTLKYLNVTDILAQIYIILLAVSTIWVVVTNSTAILISRGD